MIVPKQRIISIHFSDPNTLVETMPFASQNKLQPFLVTISTSSVLLLDFHCHLTKQEVCGYLGGSWDNNTQSKSNEPQIKLKYKTMIKNE